jgi:hypothetical protein
MRAWVFWPIMLLKEKTLIHPPFSSLYLNYEKGEGMVALSWRSIQGREASASSKLVTGMLVSKVQSIASTPLGGFISLAFIT